MAGAVFDVCVLEAKDIKLYIEEKSCGRIGICEFSIRPIALIINKKGGMDHDQYRTVLADGKGIG